MMLQHHSMFKRSIHFVFIFLMSEGISLVIKSVNQCSPDHKIECDLDLSVLSLKEIIQQQHPAAPLITDQKLIYFGQLLTDDISLRTALRHPPENNVYTVHLVYPNQNILKPEIDTGKNIYPNTMESTGVRRRTLNEDSSNEASLQAQNSINYSSYYSQFNPQLSADPSQQMAVFQQMYAQYMASYFHYLQTGNSQPYQAGTPPLTNQTPTVSQSASTTMPPIVADRNDVVANADPVAVPENNEVPQEVIPNPGNGIFGEEEIERRDWLDYVYCVSRFCILLSIVYFYSNAQRFLTVLAFFFFIFMYQQNIFGQLLNILFGNDARLEQNVQQPANNNANRPREPTPTDDRDETQSEESTGGEQIPDEVAVEVRVAHHSIMALSWTFLTGFFSSLIPDNQELL